MTPDQVQALIAAGMSPMVIAQNVASIPALFTAGMSPAQIASAFAGAGAAPAPASTNSDIAGIRAAPLPSNRNQSLSHPKGSPYTTGQAGMYDGEYAVTSTSFAHKSTDKGKLFEHTFTIDESTNPLVPKGTTRQHEIWQNTPAGKSEANGMMQVLSDALGNEGAWSDATYASVTSETQASKGLRFRLSVRTRPQKNDPKKCFTDHRYTPIADGERLGLQAVTGPVVTSPVPAVAQASAPSTGRFLANAVGLVDSTTGLVIPKEWPKNAALPYPCAAPEHVAAFVASF